MEESAVPRPEMPYDLGYKKGPFSPVRPDLGSRSSYLDQVILIKLSLIEISSLLLSFFQLVAASVSDQSSFISQPTSFFDLIAVR